MINISLLLRTAGKYPSIQVRERSAWVRDFPDVPRSCLNASGIPDWWKAGICVREIATGVGSALQQRENQAARRQGNDGVRPGNGAVCFLLPEPLQSGRRVFWHRGDCRAGAR